MPHRKKSEEIRTENGKVVLLLSGHIAHEAGTEDLKIEVFREDTEGWVLGNVYMSPKEDFCIAVPFRDKAYAFRLSKLGSYDFVDENGETVRLQGRSAGRIKLLAIEHEEYRKQFFRK